MAKIITIQITFWYCMRNLRKIVVKYVFIIGIIIIIIGIIGHLFL